MLSSAHIAQSSHAAGAPLHYCCSKIHPRTPKLLATKAKQDSAPQFSAGSDSAGQQQLGQQEAGGPVPGPYDRLQAAVPRSSANLTVNPALKGDLHVLYAIPPAKLDTPMDQVLSCPDMRHLLGQPRPNPLLTNLAGVWEGRYVSDDDRVAINVMDYACSSSIGAHRAPSIQSSTSPSPGSNTPTHNVSSSSSLDPYSSTHLALSSGIYGSLQDANGVFGSMDSSSSSSRQPGGDRVGSSGMAQQQLHYDACMPLPPYAMRAGPREHIYFDPATVTAAIVTTGNICPGMNDTIEAMVKRLSDYGVPEDNVMGIRYGMRGFWARDAKPVVLTRDKIEGIHLTGGTILGTSNDHRLKRRHHHQQQHQRHCSHESHHTASDPAAASSVAASPTGSVSSSDEDSGSSSSGGDSSTAHTHVAGRPRSPGGSPRFVTYEDRLEAILDKLEFWRINILLVIGGQGGNQLAAQLADGCQRRGIPCCIAGVPKSIDNDVMLVDKTFGFDTVVQEVVTRPLLAAKVEAASARKGVGLVKVFGRRAGFIAVQSSLASGVVDICLIPEEPFELDGPSGVIAYLQQLLEAKGHAVICVSEGAGQNLLYPGNETIPVDEAGNPKLRDIGLFLKSAIKKHIPDADVKYIDPSNMVQAVPCNAADHIFCRVLGFHAVDVAFAGYTGVMVGPVNGHFAMLPSHVITQSARRVDPRGKNWNRLRAAIGQPRFINGVPADQKRHQPASAAAAAQ